jgi:2'-5' RNA ligase
MTTRAGERLFLALWPGRAVREALASVALQHLPRGAGRRVTAPNLHLTLVFLGALAETERECLEAACGELRMAPFTLTLERLGCFARPRVLWSAPASPSPGLGALAAALREAAAGCGVEIEPRPFSAHVTLGRKLARVHPGGSHVPVPWPVSTFALVHSETHAAGARYRVRREWPLVDAGTGSGDEPLGAGVGASVE